MIEEMLAYNREFVRSRGYEKFQTSKFPDKKIAILTCMDTRLVELLPAALGIRNGDVKLIKNAGGMITGPFDSAVRSLLVGIIELGVEEVMVIGHTDCGVAHINADMMIRHLIQRGVSQDHIDMMRYCGIDFEAWLRGFDCVENSVAETVDLLRNHPLMPADVTIRGYVISGGNIDVNILNRVITRGLVMSGRKANMTIALEDKPGQLKKVAEIVSRCGSNVVSVQHDGSDPNMPISSCFLKLTLETRDAEQIEQIRAELAKEGFQLVSERV